MSSTRFRLVSGFAALLGLALPAGSQPAATAASSMPAEFLDRVEGNWEITSTDSRTPGKTEVSHVDLMKTRQYLNNDRPAEPGGRVDRGSNWRWQRQDNGEWLGLGRDVITYNGDGSFAFKGYGRKISTVRPVSRDLMRGRWKDGDTVGEETWRRLVPHITAIEFIGLKTDRANVGDRPARLHVRYDGTDGSRGNKEQFTIMIYGENLGGNHYAWVEGTDIEAYNLGILRTSPEGRTYQERMDFGGRDPVTGRWMTGYVWSGITPGTKQLHFDDLTIPFEFEVPGMPADPLAFEWMVVESSGTLRTAAQAPINSTIRLRARTATGSGPGEIDTSVTITHADGTKETRPFHLIRSQPGTVLDSAGQHLVTGAATAPDMIHVIAGDRFEATANGRAAALTIIPGRSPFSSEELAGMCEILSTRLLELYQLQDRQRAVYAELNRLVAGGRDLPRNLPDPEPLRAAIAEWAERQDALTSSRDRARSATDTLATAEIALTRAETELTTARDQLRLDPKTLRPARNGRPPNELLNERRVALENRRVNNAPANIIHEHEAAVQAVETAVASALGTKERARDTALAARDTARATLATITNMSGRGVTQAWEAVSDAARRARAQLPERLRPSMPAVSFTFDGPADGANAYQALKVLVDLRTSSGTAVATLRQNLAAKLAEADRNDAELVRLGRTITTIRAAAAVTAEGALKGLGAPDDDPAWEVFTRMHEGIKNTKDLLEPGADRLDKLEKARAYLTGSKEGAELIEAAKEHLGTVGEVLEFIGTQGDRVEKFREFQTQLGSPRTALNALSLMLSHTSDAIEGIPVIGQTVGPALTLYSKVAAAAGEAAIRIQNEQINRSLTLFAGISPRNHLYLMDEIPATVPSSEQRRVLTMLQVQRLLALIEARNATEARNVPYRVR